MLGIMGMQNMVFNDKNFKKLLSVLKNKAKTTNTKTFLGTTGKQILVDNVKRSFREKIYFEGNTSKKWVPLSQVTKRMRIKKGTWRGDFDSILQEYFNMYNNLLNGTFQRTRSGVASVGIKPSGKEREKVKAHQYGTVNIPPRPPLSIHKETADRFVDETWKYLGL